MYLREQTVKLRMILPRRDPSLPVITARLLSHQVLRILPSVQDTRLFLRSLRKISRSKHRERTRCSASNPRSENLLRIQSGSARRGNYAQD